MVANNVEGAPNTTKTRLAFAGLSTGDMGVFDYGRNYGVLYNVAAYADVLPEFGDDAFVKMNNLMPVDGLCPSPGYIRSKGKDIEDIGDTDLVKYIDVAAIYYFNKNMSAFIDYKINQLDDDNKSGLNNDDVVALGMIYEF